MLYAQHPNTGGNLGVTHKDRESFDVKIYGSIVVVPSTQKASDWLIRNGLTSITRSEAGVIYAADLVTIQENWDRQTFVELEPHAITRPVAKEMIT